MHSFTCACSVLWQYLAWLHRYVYKFSPGYRFYIQSCAREFFTVVWKTNTRTKRVSSSRKYTWLRDHHQAWTKSRHFGSFLVWGITHSSDLKQAVVAAHQSEKSYGVFQNIWSPSFCSETDYWQPENTQDGWNSSQEWASQQTHPKVRLCSAQRNCKKPKSYTLDLNGLS